MAAQLRRGRGGKPVKFEFVSLLRLKPERRYKGPIPESVMGTQLPRNRVSHAAELAQWPRRDTLA